MADERPAPRPRSGRVAGEHVERLTPMLRCAEDADASCGVLDNAMREQRGRASRRSGVDAVEHAAMAGQQPAAVLEARARLNSSRRDRRRPTAAPPQRDPTSREPREAPECPAAAARKSSERAATARRAVNPSQVLPGLTAGASLCRPRRGRRSRRRCRRSARSLTEQEPGVRVAARPTRPTRRHQHGVADQRHREPAPGLRGITTHSDRRPPERRRAQETARAGRGHPRPTPAASEHAAAPDRDVAATRRRAACRQPAKPPTPTRPPARPPTPRRHRRAASGAALRDTPDDHARQRSAGATSRCRRPLAHPRATWSEVRPKRRWRAAK